jgi:ATP-dependent DNA helicase
MYHGTPAERAELRRTVMRPDESKSSTSGVKQSDKARQKAKSQKNAKAKAKSKPKPRPRLTRRSGRFKNVEQELGEDDQKETESEKEEDDSDEDKSEPQDTVDDITMDWDENPLADEPTNDDAASSFPIVITTYEMIIKDRAHLAAYNWGYIVVDEGHRLKNLDCKLMKEIKKYSSAGRMILTGTPLHVRSFHIPPHNDADQL